MIIFLYGGDEYRRLQKKRFIIDDYAKKHSSLGVGVFDCESVEGWNNFMSFVGGQSLFEPIKLAVLENIFESKDKERIKVLKTFLDDQKTVLLISEKDKPLKAFDFLLNIPATTQEFPNLTGEAWKNFLKIESKKREIAFTPSAITFLSNAYGADSWALITTLDKAMFLGKDTLDIKDIEELGVDIAPSFWEILNGFRGSSPAMRLLALEKTFEQNEPAAKTFNILASQWKEKTPLLAAGDIAVKTGKLEYEEVLLSLVLS